jgi:hypothetical protein
MCLLNTRLDVPHITLWLVLVNIIAMQTQQYLTFIIFGVDVAVSNKEGIKCFYGNARIGFLYTVFGLQDISYCC